MTSAPGSVISTWYATALVAQFVHDARAQASLFSSTRVAVTIAQETARSMTTASSTVLTAIARLSPTSGAGGSGHGNGHASRTVAGSGLGGAERSGAASTGPTTGRIAQGITPSCCGTTGADRADGAGSTPLVVVPGADTDATGTVSACSRNGMTLRRSASGSGATLARSATLPRDSGSTARYWSAGHHAHARNAASPAPTSTAPARLRGDPSVALHTRRTVRRAIRLSRYTTDRTGSATSSTDSRRTTAPARSPSAQ